MTDKDTRELSRAAAKVELQSLAYLANAEALLLRLRARAHYADRAEAKQAQDEYENR